MDAYRQAIHVQPGYADAYTNLGAALQTQGRFKESIQACQQAIRI